MKNFIKIIILSTIFFSCKKASVPVIPTLTSSVVSNISQTSANSGGNISSDGGAAITARGLVWNTSTSPTVELATKTLDGTGVGIFSSNLINLSAGTTYFARAYATNSAGTAYGNEVTFITGSIQLPVITTAQATNISQTSATSGGNITSDGGATITARGLVWSTSPNPTVTLVTKTLDGTGVGIFSSNIINLSPGTTYYARAYATNSAGTAYGSQMMFNTLVGLATLTTPLASDIKNYSATLGGNITSDGGSSITAAGVVWSTSPNPNITLVTKATITQATINGNRIGVGSMSFDITGLVRNTLYYCRSYATNSAGTSYGNEISFTTSNAPISIGDLTYGGKITYILVPGDPGYDANVQHGLVAATQILAGAWAKGIEIEVGVYDGALGTGLANTNKIISVNGNAVSYAATVCRNYRGGGYSDWFLPSKDELNKLFLNKSIIELLDKNAAANTFWSSTEASVSRGLSQNLSNGDFNPYPKNTAYFVVPIRTF